MSFVAPLFLGATQSHKFTLRSDPPMLTRSRTSQARTDFIAKRIINMTVETNLVSSTLAVLTVILLAGLPGKNYFTCTSIIRGKV
ncbi:hypothetical protein K438DRAFT_1831126 [Mycena galopus ATCC 62051]|nr:hypothetical protein K438DRAFT_1831126 [Mycena galopus ATCC 62051]